LNTLVSGVAVERRIWVNEKSLIKNVIIGCLIGIGLGLIVYPYLSEQLVLFITATLLLIGVLTTLLPIKSYLSPFGHKVLSGLSGLATVWAATPGPLMMFGFLAIGRSAQDARRLVQPVALIAYGVAFALHGMFESTPPVELLAVMQFALAAVLGSILGRKIGPNFSHNTISNAIRIISIFACAALFRSAYLVEHLK
jgi:uncharacterized membrane protein YfcA